MAQTIYTSISANRFESNLQTNQDTLLFSKANCPIIYNLKKQQVEHILIGHDRQVNGQAFIDNGHVISTSYDSSAIIWAFDELGYKLLFKLIIPNSGEEFKTRRSIRLDNGVFISITSTLDKVYLWENDQLKETIETRNCCLESKIFHLSCSLKNLYFIFLANSDNKIQIYQLDSLNVKLHYLMDLTGHSDWTKSLDVMQVPGREFEFLLASASQDSYVRIWLMKIVNCDSIADQTSIRTSISKSFLADTNHKLTATLETVLSGHEGKVTSLCWFKRKTTTLQLISCSADKTIIIWRSQLASVGAKEDVDGDNSASEGVWKILSNFGETGETNLPFLSICLSDDEKTFYAHSLKGAIHSWTMDQNNSDVWLPGPSILGHHEPITDLCWEKSGAYLLSASLDKTCRLHSPSSLDNRWHELARPQVHGHELNCLVSLKFDQFATGAEEKTIRTYGATQFFLKNFKHLAAKEALSKVPQEIDLENYPKHAQLPALGLSIKGAQYPYDVEQIVEPGQKKSAGDASNIWLGQSKLVEELVNMDHLTSLPVEEILLQSTLWWETNKLFGHGNELHSLAATHNSPLAFMASASRANKPDLAAIIIWECDKFRKVATIEHHTLTITRLRFSPNDRFLLSVSRDRTWCLSEKAGQQIRGAYGKLMGTNKTNAIHDRIIWDCAWTFDSSYFITVSRDKKAILWSIDCLKQSENICCFTSKALKCSIQAVDSPNIETKAFAGNRYLFVFGFEDGSIELTSITVGVEKADWQQIQVYSNFHHLPIRRLAFKPSTAKEQELVLASAGDDSILKLTRFTLG